MHALRIFIVKAMKRPKQRRHTVGSMFAGIGGICLAFQKVGCKVVWANEIDKYACATYRLNFGDKYLVQGDVKNVDPNTLPKFDILTAGFPCQAFSAVGLKDGFEDPRGNLFFEVIRIARSVVPRVILLENVANLTKHLLTLMNVVTHYKASLIGISMLVSLLTTMKEHLNNIGQNSLDILHTLMFLLDTEM